jgi:predicted O-methyltransferase YrrM
MFSKNFYYRLKYQISKKATFKVLYNFVLDRLKHPFIYKIKKQKKDEHKNYLTAKHFTKDYFSLNAYYWHSIINKTFNRFSYLEIGSWEGNSAMFILKNFNTKNVTCVDIWDLYNDNSKSEQVKRFNNFQSNLKEFNDRFSFYKSTSDEFFKNNGKKYDVIYIDGWHEAPQVYRDICNSWNCLNEGGLVICDDFFYGDIISNKNNNLPADSINRFILENQNKLKILNVNNTQIFIKKIK